MGTMLGKRKRRPATPESDSPTESANDDALAIFKAHFEASFAPLPLAASKAEAAVPEDELSSFDGDDEDETDWEGISEPEVNPPIEVIEHTTPALLLPPKHVLKSFLSPNPPPSSTPTTPLTPSARPRATSPTEAAHQTNDLALHRLLTESHLLASTKHNQPNTPSGKTRLRATDLRLQALGAKTSVFGAGTMPRAQWRGVVQREEKREVRRREEARGNGVVLERGGRKKGRGAGRRERGVDGVGVGRFSGGTLRLSRRDVGEIEGRGRGGGRGGKRGGRR